MQRLILAVIKLKKMIMTPKLKLGKGWKEQRKNKCK